MTQAHPFVHPLSSNFCLTRHFLSSTKGGAILARGLCAALGAVREEMKPSREIDNYGGTDAENDDLLLRSFRLAGSFELLAYQSSVPALVRTAATVRWLESAARSFTDVLIEAEYLSNEERNRFAMSVEEMKTDMRNNKVDLDNLCNR
jgi:hypothetical protein